jgi:hypothetical protein
MALVAFNDDAPGTATFGKRESTNSRNLGVRPNAGHAADETAP